VKDLEQNNGRLTRRLSMEEQNPTATMLNLLGKSLRGVDFHALAKMVCVSEGGEEGGGEEGAGGGGVGGGGEGSSSGGNEEESPLEHDLRLATEEEAGIFYRGQQELSTNLADLSRNIDLKEKLLKQLHESIKRYEVMRKYYEEKLKIMSEETARHEAERQKLLAELAQTEKNKADGGQKERHQTLLHKIQEKEAQLNAAMKKQEELGRLARQAQKTDTQLRQVSEEIQSLKRQRVELLNRIDTEKRRFQAILKEKTTEIETMRRAAQ
jgi:kinesin family protein 4/21/27